MRTAAQDRMDGKHTWRPYAPSWCPGTGEGEGESRLAKSAPSLVRIFER